MLPANSACIHIRWILGSRPHRCEITKCEKAISDIFRGFGNITPPAPVFKSTEVAHMTRKIHGNYGRCAVLLGVAWNGSTAINTDKMLSFLFELRKIKWLPLLFPSIVSCSYEEKGLQGQCLLPGLKQFSMVWVKTVVGERKSVILGFKEPRP